MRIRSTSFSAEKTLTRDTVPVNVDAVLFWVVVDAKKAVLEVKHFEKTVSWAAQTTLRDVIGKTELLRMIAEREALDEEDASGLAIVDRTFVRFKPDLLPRRRSPVPASAATGWRLDPTWRHRDWLSRFDV